MRHRDLLAAISELDPVAVQGEFERHTSMAWDELKPSPAGGRWGAPGAYEVLYVGRPRDSVVVEAYRHLVDDELDDAQGLAATVLERRVLTCDVAVANVLDLRPATAQNALQLTPSDLFSHVGDYATCQRVGAGAHQLGLAGILAPSASRLGETLALFAANLPLEQTPRVVARDVWHGLPPDPRRLRVVEDTA